MAASQGCFADVPVGLCCTLRWTSARRRRLNGGTCFDHTYACSAQLAHGRAMGQWTPSAAGMDARVRPTMNSSAQTSRHVRWDRPDSRARSRARARSAPSL